MNYIMHDFYIAVLKYDIKEFTITSFGCSFYIDFVIKNSIYLQFTKDNPLSKYILKSPGRKYKLKELNIG